MKKVVVIPIAVAIVVSGVVAKKLFTGSKKQDQKVPVAPTLEEEKLTETHKILRARGMY